MVITLKHVQAVVLSIALVTATFVTDAFAASEAAAEPQNQGTPQATPATAPSAPSPQEMQQLVAPIALYPDALVAQVVAAATYPTQLVEAARWVQQNSNLKGNQLASAVDRQPWDASIKALTQFPSVLNNMNQNLSWTSALGDAYFNDPSGVMTAIQALRRNASSAGNLESNPQQTVTTEGQTIIIQPADPEVVYVPEYSPAVYGTAIEPYPGYSGWDVAGASLLSFGVGTLVGAAFGGGWGWGWGHWGANWHGGSATFNRNAYVSRSNTFVNRNSRYAQANRGNFAGRNQGALNRPSTLPNRGAGFQGQRPSTLPNRGAGFQGQRPSTLPNRGAGFQGQRPSNLPANRPSTLPNRPGGQAGLGFGNRERQNPGVSRGFGQAGQSSLGSRSNAFGNYRQGGSARFDSSRGRSSFSGRSGGGRVSGGGGRRGGGGGGRGGGGGGRRGGGGGRR
jgi:hypothetical protein